MHEQASTLLNLPATERGGLSPSNTPRLPSRLAYCECLIYQRPYGGHNWLLRFIACQSILLCPVALPVHIITACWKKRSTIQRCSLALTLPLCNPRAKGYQCMTPTQIESIFLWGWPRVQGPRERICRRAGVDMYLMVCFFRAQKAEPEPHPCSPSPLSSPGEALLGPVWGVSVLL